MTGYSNEVAKVKKIQESLSIPRKCKFLFFKILNSLVVKCRGVLTVILRGGMKRC
jgi:hypothetical protein